MAGRMLFFDTDTRDETILKIKTELCAEQENYGNGDMYHLPR